jgi:hypothetical protein
MVANSPLVYSAKKEYPRDDIAKLKTVTRGNWVGVGSREACLVRAGDLATRSTGFAVWASAASTTSFPRRDVGMTPAVQR